MVNVTLKINLRKILVVLIQLAVLFLPCFLVWGDSIFLLGLAAIFLAARFNLRFTGWVGSAAYLITYWISALYDTPEQGNLYVYWYLSYIGILLIVLIADLILKFRRYMESQDW